VSKDTLTGAKTTPVHVADPGTSAAQKKRKELGKQKIIPPPILEVIDHWNTKEYLRTHNVKHTDGKALVVEQTKTLRTAIEALRKVMAGTYYSRHADVPDDMRRKKFNVGELKGCIDRLNTSMSPEYTHKSARKKLPLENLIECEYAKLTTSNKDKYKYKYPLIHWMYNTPKACENAHFKTKTEYNILVDRVISKLKDRALQPRQYNHVVAQVEKAVEFIDSKANGNRMELRRRLPDLLYDSLGQVGKGYTVDALALGVYNLERMMKERSIIK
jgi:hypothetical protein